MADPHALRRTHSLSPARMPGRLAPGRVVHRARLGWVDGATAYAAALVVSAALLSWVAIANGYPLLFADSGTYLRIGAELYFPTDRPATYGLAILPLVRIGGVWAVVAAQGLLAAWLIGRVIETMLGRRAGAALLAASMLLAAGSGLPWFTGQLMPDVLTGLGALAVFLLACAWDRLWTWERTLLPALVAAIVAAHLSHVPVLGAAAVAGLIAAPARRGGMVALGGIGAGVLALCLLNLAGAGMFRPSLQSDAFLLARLFDARLAQPVLRAACDEADPPALCAVRAQVDRSADPLPGQSYLWAFDTPRETLKKRDPARLAREEKALVRRTIAARPRAVFDTVLAGTLRQIVTARAGDGMIAYGPKMQVRRQVAELGDADAVAASRQQQGRLHGLGEALHPRIALLCAAACLALALIARRRRDALLGGLLLVAAATLLANAATCGVLSGVFDRYQARVLWLLPFVAIAGLLRIRGSD